MEKTQVEQTLESQKQRIALENTIAKIIDEYNGSHVVNILGWPACIAMDLIDERYAKEEEVAKRIWKSIVALATVNWESKTMGISGSVGNLMSIHDMLVKEFKMEAQYDKS